MKNLYALPLVLLAFALVFCGPPDRVGEMLVDAGNAMRDGGASAAVATVEWRTYDLECVDGTTNFEPVDDATLLASRVLMSRLVQCAPLNGEVICSQDSISFGFKNGSIIPPSGGCDGAADATYRLSVVLRTF